MHRFSILLMVLFLQFGMLTLRCDHIEECNKTLIFHLSIEDLSLSPGSPILKSHSQMSQMKSKSTTQRTPQNVMYILGIQLHLMRKCKLSFLQHWQFGDTFTLYHWEGDPGIFIVIVAAGGATSLSPRWTWLVQLGQQVQLLLNQSAILPYKYFKKILS